MGDVNLDLALLMLLFCHCWRHRLFLLQFANNYRPTFLAEKSY